MQNSAKWAVRIIAAILVLSLIAGFAVMAFAEQESTLQEALDSGASSYQLTNDVDGITIDKDFLLDLNGHKATNMTVAEGATLQLVDSANDTYDAAKCGSFSGTVNGTLEQVVKHDTKNYLVIETDGAYSAHRFYAGIDRISLVPDAAALGYKAIFKADAVINAMVESYGYRLWVNSLNAKTYAATGPIVKEELTARVKNILDEGNASLSQFGATATIHGMATITFSVNGQTVTVDGAEHATTLQQAVEAVNTSLGQNSNAYSDTQIQSVRDMLNKFESYTNPWEQEYIFTEDKFEAVENVSTTYGESLTLGQVFTAVEGMTIGENVTVTVNGEAISVDANWADTVLTLNAGEAVITITDNDRCWTATNTVEVAKADPSYELPTGLTAIYGETLADVELPEGFSWVDSAVAVGNAGTQTHQAIYNAGENYNTVEVSVTVEVAKADIVAPAVETLNATYGQTLVDVELPEGFSWVDSAATVGNAGTQTHTAIYNAGENYNTVEVSVTVAVAKANVEAPEVGTLNATYGQTLADVELPEGFSWVDSAAAVGNAGTQTHTAIYNKGENYNTVEVAVTVEVAKATVEAPEVGTLNATYGQTLADVELPEGFSWVDSTASVGNAGTQTHTAIYNAGENYNTVEVTVSVAVAKATVEAPEVGTLNATYGQTLADVALPDGFTWVDSTASVGNAGTQTHSAIYNEGDNYNTVEVTVTVEVAKADPEFTPPENLEATEGDALATVKLPEGFTWVDGEETVSLEKAEYAATYSNGDANYNTVNVNIPVTVNPAAPAVQIERKMPKAAFTYRLGNMNAVSINSLIKTSDGSAIDLTKLTVSVDAQDGHAVSGAYDETKGELTFTGTGVVEITFTGNANSVLLTFEIVNAKNATSAASATANNVVLLNDVGFSSASVGNGYTLFGNGFTMTATSETYANGFGDSFLALNNGTLDNVRIVVPFFAYSFLYQSQAYDQTAVAGPHDGTYYNFRSAVYMTGNSKILNSYISGGRAAVYTVSGNPVLENTTLYGGATANLHVGNAKTLTLKDMTLIQKPIEGSVNGESKNTVMGFGVIIEGATDGTVPTEVTLEGYLDEFAWANDSYSAYVPEGSDAIITYVKKQTQYLHSISVDGVYNDEWLNLGIVYWPMGTTGTVATPKINDNRTNQSEVPYEYAALTALGVTGHVYSINNTNAKDVTTPMESAIQTNGVTAPKISLNASGDGITTETAYDATYGWMSSMTVDLDTTGNYTFDFANLVATKYGKNLSYTVTDASGNAVGTTVALTDSGVHEYTLTITDNVDCNGSAVHTYPFVLTATKTSIAGPVKVADVSGTALIVVASKDSDWSIAVPALEGAQVKYWNKTNKAYETLSLSTLTPTTKGKQNGTNNFWEYADPNGNFTLKVTSGYIHEGKQVYGMPVVADNGGKKLYFTISSTNGYVSTSTTSRAVTISYVFTDSNGQSVSFSKAWNCDRSTMINAGSKQYSYSSFVSGTLKEASGTCVTGDTLVTLADGSQVRVDQLTGTEELLVWNHTTGSYDIAPIAYIVNHDEQFGEHVVSVLHFADGTQIKIVEEHVFFDADQNKYVAVTKDNAQQFVGHSFAVMGENGLTDAELLKVEEIVEETGLYEVVTYKNITCFTNGILSASAYLDPLLNIFDIDSETMAYVNVAEDIETYGLYTYADFEGLIEEEAFELYNAAYLKIAVGKGYITWDDILDLIDIYFNVGVQPLSE